MKDGMSPHCGKVFSSASDMYTVPANDALALRSAVNGVERVGWAQRRDNDVLQAGANTIGPWKD
jgi:hypothetical protein